MCCKRLHCGKEGSSGIEQRTLADVGERVARITGYGRGFLRRQSHLAPAALRHGGTEIIAPAILGRHVNETKEGQAPRIFGKERQTRRTGQICKIRCAEAMRGLPDGIGTLSGNRRAENDWTTGST